LLKKINVLDLEEKKKSKSKITLKMISYDDAIKELVKGMDDF